MSNLAFYASPVDFQKNDKLNNKIEEMKKNKLNSDVLKKLSKPSESQISNIHENLNHIKEENESELADYYSSELAETQELQKKLSETRIKQNLYLEGQNKDYMISNNLNMNKISNATNNDYSNNNNLGGYTNAEILTKLNHIIGLFEEQKEIKTNQKNEEIVLYCFLGIFVIYVLDSFVYIGKYSR